MENPAMKQMAMNMMGSMMGGGGVPDPSAAGGSASPPDMNAFLNM